MRTLLQNLASGAARAFVRHQPVTDVTARHMEERRKRWIV